jgi:hypothetical protein
MPRLRIATLCLLLAACSAGGPISATTPTTGLAQVDLPDSCLVQPTNGGFPRYARLMHDPQWMPWPSRMGDPEWPSGYHFDEYPETVQLLENPRSGDGRFRYTRPWLEYLRELQPDDETAVWIARIAAGLFNRGNADIPILNLDQLQELPMAESISAGGNVAKVLEMRNGAGRIEMLYIEDTPPSVEEINYALTPWLVTKFTSIAEDGSLGNAGGIDVYFPNLAAQEEGYWVDLDRVEFFPFLAMCVTVKEEGMNLHAAASESSQIVAPLPVGQSLAVREYLPQASDVWGRTDYGWLLLAYQTDGVPIYPTTWEMETRPPILLGN